MDNKDKVPCLVWHYKPRLINDELYFEMVPFKYFDYWQDAAEYVNYSGLSSFCGCGYDTVERFESLYKNKLLQHRTQIMMDDPELIKHDPEPETKDEKVDRNYYIPSIICDRVSDPNGDKESYLYIAKQVGIDYYDPVREKLAKDGAKSTREILVWLAKHLIRVDIHVNKSSKRINRDVYRGAFITDVHQEFNTSIHKDSINTSNAPIYIEFDNYYKTEGEIQIERYKE